MKSDIKIDHRTIAEARQEFRRLQKGNSIEVSIEYFDLFIRCYCDVASNHHSDEVSKHLDKVTKQSYLDAKLVLQMMLSKFVHLQHIIKGVSYSHPGKGLLLEEIIDPTIVTTLARNVYETVCMFNIVYISPNTDEKKKILYLLWSIAGLKYRQKFSEVAITEASIKKQEQEELLIEDFINKIKSTDTFQNLDDKNKGKIETKIKEKDYKIKIEDNKVRFLTWQDISQEFITTSNHFNLIYTYFSLYAHPSNVSVFQFSQMFEDKSYLEIGDFSVRFCLSLGSIFLSDFIKIFPKTLASFENRTEFEQILLNAYNKMLRGEDSSINDLWKKLG